MGMNKMLVIMGTGLILGILGNILPIPTLFIFIFALGMMFTGIFRIHLKEKIILLLFGFIIFGVFILPEVFVLGWIKLICPLGISKDQIKEIIIENRWSITNEKSNIKIFKNCIICNDIDGDQYISADITNYLGIYIDAYWGFNEKGELIDVYVRKSVLSL